MITIVSTYEVCSSRKNDPDLFLMLFLYFGASVEFNNAIEKQPFSEKNILTSNLNTFQYI